MLIDQEDAAAVLEIGGYVLKAVPDSSNNLRTFHPQNTIHSKMKGTSRLSLAAEVVKWDFREIAAIDDLLK